MGRDLEPERIGLIGEQQFQLLCGPYVDQLPAISKFLNGWQMLFLTKSGWLMKSRSRSKCFLILNL
jgi:hypothetical protein